MHDLEIRGAGEVLGESQSGEMQEVGFQLYADMLRAAVSSLQGRAASPISPRRSASTTEINLHVPALLPATYCSDVHERLVLYKRLANGESLDDLDAMQEELVDRFGSLPEPAQALIACHRLRVVARPLGVVKIDAGPERTTIQFVPNAPFDAGALILLVQKDGRDPLRRARPHPHRARRADARRARGDGARVPRQARVDRGERHADAPMRAALPPQVHVFVRDWLSANHVLLKSRDGHVLVDTGYVRHAPLTLALLATPRGLGDEPLAQIVNTHCHSDHMGGNAAVARRYGCPIAVPEGECAADRALGHEGAAARLRRPDRRSLPRRTPRCAPDTTYVWGDLEWRALAAPGHDMGALVFYNPEHRILISGDALWENGFGFVMPPRDRPDGAAGHARHARDAGHARRPRRHSRARRAVHRRQRRARAGRCGASTPFEADPLRMARHALKVAVHLLPARPPADAARRRAGAIVERVGIYRDFNALFFRLPPAELADAADR